MSALEPTVRLLAERLAEASLAGLLAAAVVWSVCRWWPKLSVDVRAALWWLVPAKMLIVLAWPAPIPLALLPAPAATAPAPFAAEVATIDPTSIGMDASPLVVDAAGTLAPAARHARSWHWPVVALWVAGALLLLAADFLRSFAARRRVEQAPSLDGVALGGALAGLTERLATDRVRLRLGDEREGARVLGPWRPVLVLPPSVVALPEDQLRMVLAHELAHVHRGDLWWGLLPAIGERLFFFHPAAWLAAREYRLAREAACDAAVLRRLDTAPREYGRLLLRLGVVTRSAVGVGASSPRGHLKRRLEMLEHASRTVRRWPLLILLPLLLALVAPIRLVARDSDPAPPPEVTATATADPDPEWVFLSDDAADADTEWVEDAEAENEGILEAREDREVRATERAERERERVERAREREERALERALEAREKAERSRWEGRSYGDWNGGLDDGVSFVLLTGDETMMHGASWEADVARRLRRGDEDLLLVRRPDGDWLIRDPKVIANARKIFEPQRELGRQQAELGRRQAALGERQAALGAKQAELGSQAHELGMRQADLSAQLQGSVADELEIQARSLRLAQETSEMEAAELEQQRRELEQRRQELERRARKLEETMRSLSDEMRELGGPQRELGSRQAALGMDQAELGARQAKLGQAQREASEKAGVEMRELIERAIANGVAEKVDE